MRKQLESASVEKAGDGGFCVRCFVSTSAAVCPSKGNRPLSIVYAMTPSE